jgi:hypothetical protein
MTQKRIRKAGGGWQARDGADEEQKSCRRGDLPSSIGSAIGTGIPHLFPVFPFGLKAPKTFFPFP